MARFLSPLSSAGSRPSERSTASESTPTSASWSRATSSGVERCRSSCRGRAGRGGAPRPSRRCPTPAISDWVVRARLERGRRPTPAAPPSRSTVNSGESGSSPSSAIGATSSGEWTTQRARRFSVPISVTSNPEPVVEAQAAGRAGSGPGRAAAVGTVSYHLIHPPRARWTTSQRPPGLDADELAPSLDAGRRSVRPARRAAGSTVFKAANDASSHRVDAADRPSGRPRPAVRASTSGSSGTGQLWTLGARSIWSHPPGSRRTGRRVRLWALPAGRPGLDPPHPTRPTDRKPVVPPGPRPNADFTALETEELARWAAHRVFERSVELRAGAEPWVFYEGPPTANGRPGLHHVWARVYKDLFCRYRTMRGYAVPRKAGWDTHGLPVEVEVEKQLGHHRQAPDRGDGSGIAEFTRLCRESVRNYVDDWRALTERIGYWIDFDDAYWTFSPEYVESVWWNLKNLWDQGLLYEDIKVVPYCPRCGTALSQPRARSARRLPGRRGRVGLRPVPAARRRGGGRAPPRPRSARDTLDGLSLVVWTTTPWTLLSNTGAAVGPDLDYAVVGRRDRGRRPGRSRCSATDAVVDRRRSAAATWSGSTTSGPSPTSSPGRTDAGRRLAGGGRRVRRRRRGDRHRPPGPGLRRGRPPGRAGTTASRPSTRSVPTAASPTTSPGWRASRCARPTPRSTTASRPPGRLLRREPYVHPYPHCWRCDTAAHLLGQAELVRADLRAQGRPGRAEPDHRVAPRAHPRRADGGVAGQQRRLGALPRPVLGHAAPGLAVR